MKSPKQTIRVLTLSAGLVGLCLILATANAATRPISDWANAQGTYYGVESSEYPGSLDCALSHYQTPADVGSGFLWVPPVRNYLGWVYVNKAGVVTSMSMDYAGLANAYL